MDNQNNNSDVPGQSAPSDPMASQPSEPVVPGMPPVQPVTGPAPEPVVPTIDPSAASQPEPVVPEPVASTEPENGDGGNVGGGAPVV